jgi:hypothetical protein
LQKRVHAGIFLGGPQALQTTRYAHDASRIHINEHFMIAVIEGVMRRLLRGFVFYARASLFIGNV